MNKQWQEGGPVGDELARVQRGIDECLRQTVRHRPYSPGELPSSGTVTVVGAPTVTESGQLTGRGWIEARPLEPPLKPGSMADRAVGGMVDAAFPPSPAEQLARIKAQLRALGPEQREQLLKEIEAKPGDARAKQLRELAEEAWS
jgi:hypothetical protein